MRVAHVITRMIIGGAQENTLLNCLDLMRDFGDDVLLITGPEVGPEGDLLSQGRAGELPICKLDNLRRAINPLRDLRGRRELRAAIRKFKPDVVHTHSAKAGILGRAVAWREGVPAVIHSVHGAPFHEYQSPLARALYRSCERWAAKRCHHLISVADAMTDLMVAAQVAPRDMFTTIHSGMDVEPFLQASRHRDRVRRQLGLAEDAIVIGKIARLFHLKGHEDLISAAIPVVERVPQVRFLLVGDGIRREPLTRHLESLGLSEHFVFAGLVPPDEVPSLIGAMDLLVHTSYREGLARALPQALIAGRPVVSYDIDGAREVAISGETGFLVPPGDIAQLAHAITQLSRDRELRQRLGRAGQRRFTEQFRHQTMTRRIRQLYQRVLSGQGPIELS
ncbi:MAG: glycosyltransferase family 4 protein [Novipirellula sp. JB048]